MNLLTFEEWITTVLVRALGWTFTHSIWQALLALLLAYTLLAMMKKARPSARYNLLLAVSVLLIIAVTITFIYQLNQNTSAATGITNNSSFKEIFYNSSTAASPVMVESKRLIDLVQDYFNQNLHLFVALWFLIFSVKWLRLSLNLNYVNRISRFESAPVNDEWQKVVNELGVKLGVSEKVKLLHSKIVKVPLVSGILKPVILVPAGMFSNMPAYLIESILLHELAHIRRCDYLVNILQSSLETIFFFNPFILKLSGLIREEREACCDAIAVEATNNKVSYVEALIAFGEYSTTSAPMLAFAGSKNHLLQRVKRILYNQNKKPGFMEKSILFSSVILLSVITAFTTINNDRQPAVPVVHELKTIATDTIPEKANADNPVNTEPKRKKKVRDAEKNHEQKQKQLEAIQIDMEKVQKQIEEQIKDLDLKEQMKDIDIKIDLQKEKMVELQQLKMAEVDKVMQLINEKKIALDFRIDIDQKELEHSKLLAIQVAEQLKQQQFLIDSVTTHFNLNLHGGFMNDDVARILDFLERNNVAAAKDVKSFTLNNEELTVNGKKQSASLHQQLREKYIGGKDDHIIYSNSGGSKSISIKLNKP